MGDGVAFKKTTKKKATKKKKTVKKPTKRNKKISNFNDFKKVFFERLGMVSFIIILLLSALIFLMWRIQRAEFPSTQNVDYETSVDYRVRQDFVTAIAPIAQRLQRKYGIFASVSMAQAMLESEFGQSGLADEHLNLFGVKTDADDPMGADWKTSEYIDGEWIEIVDRFKVYNSWGESMEAHAQLLVNGTSWDPDYYKDVTDGKTPEAQAKGLQSAGYATDPDYANKLINMMEEWDLYQYNQPVVEEVTTVVEETTSSH